MISSLSIQLVTSNRCNYLFTTSTCLVTRDKLHMFAIEFKGICGAHIAFTFVPIVVGAKCPDIQYLINS